MNTTEQVLEYAKSVHLALKARLYLKGCTSQTILTRGMTPTLSKSWLMETWLSLKSELLRRPQVRDGYDVRSPRHQHSCKGHKGSKDKRGIEGFILHAKEPMQGSGKHFSSMMS